MEVSAEDGRVYIPKETRERMGTEFELIDRGDKILLLPIPENPLENLQEDWKDVDKSAKELKKDALKEGLEEAGG